jgi:hypothetical protein
MADIVEIIGITQRRKNGLVISGDNDYFIKNNYNWEDKFLNKKVKAKGIVTITQNNAVIPPNDDGIIRQGIPTHSWQEYHAINTQHWIQIIEIEVIED